MLSILFCVFAIIGTVLDVTLAFRVGHTRVWNYGGALSFVGKMDIDADGSPHAYNPENTGLDDTRNAGRPGHWFGIVTVNGQPYVQRAADPAPGYYLSPTSLEDNRFRVTDSRRYLNSEIIPYIVLPSGHLLNVRLGDVAWIRNTLNSKTCCAIVGDVGPKNKIGEGSIALAERLGIPSSARHGGVTTGIQYIVFPGSGSGLPLTVSGIDSIGRARFSAWGGLVKADEALDFSKQH